MRILILSDVHSNFRGLQAVLDRFGDADEVWCLGDIVEFGPCPGGCIALVRERCNRVVKGNHDANFVGGDMMRESPKGDRIVSPEPRGWARYDRHTVSDDDIAWLDGLPESVTLELDGRSALLIHGTPADPLSGKLFPLEHTGAGPPGPSPSGDSVPELSPADSPDAYRAALANGAADVILSGHTHVAMVERFEGKTVVNTGTVGQPRDRDYRAQCMVYERGRFRFERVDYDLAALARDYERSSLPDEVKRTWLGYTRRAVLPMHGVQLGPFSGQR